jgi:putative addiction module CopG family antidote
MSFPTDSAPPAPATASRHPRPLMAWAEEEPSMPIQVAPDLAAMIRRQVDSGRYATVDELIADALRSLDEREHRRQHLLALLAEAEEETERGEVVEWTPEILREEAEEMVQRGIAPDPDLCP